MMHDPRPQPLSLLEAEPVVVDGLFGWFSPGVGRRGVVLCGATGFEQLSAHRPWRELAGRIAATGCATLRFDYPGEGDSTDAGAGTLAAWRDAIRRAVGFLREEAGVAEVVLVWLRLGATLAALAAAEDGDIDRLVLLAPFRTGRAYLREMTMRAPALNVLSDGTVPVEPPGHLSIGGFPIGPGLAADLAGIDIASVAVRPAPRIMILGAEGDALAARYAALGAEATSGPLPGLAQFVGDPLFAVTPHTAFADVVGFVAEGAIDRDLPRPKAAPVVSAPACLAGDGWREEAVQFGPGLFGVHARPSGPSTGAPTVLFVATGLSVHSGWGRQTTQMARAFATAGVPSLRMDFAGIGDSADRTDGTSPLFTPDTLDDFRQTLDHLDTRGGGKVVLVGTCSGAYAAFHAACRDHRVAGALLANPYCFDWHPDDDVHAIVRRTVGSAATYAALLRRGTTWRRLLKGEIGFRAIGTVLLRRGLSMAGRRWRDLFRPGPVGGSVVRRIRTMRCRGVRLRLVYTVGDPGLAALRRHIGRTSKRAALRLGAPVAIIEGTDHHLATPEAQVQVSAILRDLVDAVAQG